MVEILAINQRQLCVSLFRLSFHSSVRELISGTVVRTAGYLGAGVVGLFICVFGGWGIGRWWKRRQARKALALEEMEEKKEEAEKDHVQVV